MRDGSLNGRLLRKRSLTKLKMAVLRPIPSASVNTAIKVKVGDCRSLRNAKRISFMLEVGLIFSDHSVRKAMIGSTREARLAGIQEARKVAPKSSSPTPR